MFDTKDSVEDLLNFVTTFKRQREILFNQVGDYDKMLGDLDHELELKSMNGAKMLVWANERKNILLERRKKKDELYVLSELEKRFPDMNTLYGQIKGIINAKKEIEKGMENRFYRPRILTDRFDVPTIKKEDDDQIVDNIKDKIDETKKLKKVDNGNIIKNKSNYSMELDALFEKVRQERIEKENLDKNKECK